MNTKTQFTQKILSIVLTLILILMPLSPVVYAQEAETQTQTTEQANPLQTVTPLDKVEQPKQPVQPDPSTVTEPSSPSQPQGAVSEVTVTPTPTDPPLKKISKDEYFGVIPSTTSSPSDVQKAANPQGAGSNGNVGTTTLGTGDASSNAGITNTGNTNASGVAGCCGTGATAVNNGNGAHSTNNTQSASTNTNDTTQNNTGAITNELDSATVTGKNSTSFNVGDSSLNTGDANTTGTIYNNVNSNLSGVSVSEFNIADDYNGDYVLDFAANCILGCGGTGLGSAVNSGNGAGSDNTARTDSTNTNSTTQTNDGVLVNNLNLLADSGHNYASFNTGGDSNITTGDANVSANVLNFMNTNATGNVILGVVNIFGDLIGDILLPAGFGSSTCTTCGSNGSHVANTDNGAHSTNTANSSTTNNSDTFQKNDATIENNLILTGVTGDNKTSFNTDGNSAVTTGATNVNAQLLNVANMNISGGDWFLVIVNEAGKWVGKIIGSPDGANFGGTSGTEFAVDENGQISASNTGNGAGSNNSSNNTSTNNESVNQQNNASIVNNITLDANTGGNTSSYNTGGTSDIVTGDATVIANLVNFVNNNISGGRLVVTVVNVFGSWMGDFVSPGQTQREKTALTNQKFVEQMVVSQNTPNGQGSNQESESEDQSSHKSTENVPAYGTLKTNPENNTQTSVQTGSGSSLAQVGTTGNSNVAVLGQKTTAQETIDKAIKVNMAWMVVILPLVIILGSTGYLLRRKLLHHKQK